MGASESKPIKDFSKEDISVAVANLGEPYQAYVDALMGNGVDGTLLDTLEDEEVEETLDDLGITNRLHRRVLVTKLDDAKSNKGYVSLPYDYSSSTQTSDLQPYEHVTNMCFREYKQTAVLAGVHLVLENGDQLSLDTKILQSGTIVTNKLHRPRRSSLCSSIVNDGRNQDYYKLLLPREIHETLFDDTSPVTYTGYILKNECGKREGILCMLDRCAPSDIVDTDREFFLCQRAKDAEYHLRLRKQLLDRKKILQNQINECRNESLRDSDREEHRNDIVLSANGPIKPVLKSQIVRRWSQGNPLSYNEGKRASHLLPVFQNMSTEAERAHLPLDFYDCVDAISCPRPPIAKNDMECSAIVEALGLTEINPEDEIAIHLKDMVKMATQVFGFPNAEITFRNHKTIFCMAGYGQNKEISDCSDYFSTIKRNKDGTKFLWSMPRALAICNYVTALGGSFVVQDIAADESFQWVVASTPSRCYAGTAIKDSCGRPMAVLCLHDAKPRPDFEAAHEIQLEQLASLIAQSIENWALLRNIERLENERKSILECRNKNKQKRPKDNVTFVLTDIEGCIDMWDANPAAMQRGQSIHDDIIKELCAGNFGYEVGIEGHSFILAFHDPEDAFGFALQAQTALFLAQWPEDLLRLPHAKEEQGAFRGFRVKMAVHQGNVVHKQNEESELVDYMGDTMHITKNILDIAHGGQILSTTDTWDVASYFMGSTLEFPQVLDHGSHVIQKGETIRDGVITKRIVQLVPSKLAYDYFTARKLSLVPERERHHLAANNQFPGRQFPPICSLKQVSPSFHDAPFVDNEVTMAFVNLSAISEHEASSVMNLIGILLDGLPEFCGYQCQGEMLAFHRPLDAILFGLHLQKELESRYLQEEGSRSKSLIGYACVCESFLTMGPHRTTGRADYFGKIVNRAARLCKAVALGSVCFGVVCNEGDDNHEIKHIDAITHPSVESRFSGKKRLKGIREEVSVYEYKSKLA